MMEGRVVSVSIKTSYRHDPHTSILLPDPSNCSWCVGMTFYAESMNLHPNRFDNFHSTIILHHT